MSFANATLASVGSGVPIERVSPYGYIPTEWICILFIVLFALTGLIHLAQTFYSRLWWLAATTVLAGLIEVIGWSGRLWSSISPKSINPFLMQITTTIIAPTPLIAANFIILGEIIRRLGQQYSRLSAMYYTIIFCSCDIIALVVQAIGGAKASIALQSGNGDPEVGGHIMLAGIVFQLVAVIVYLSLATEFLVRYHYDNPVRRASPVPPKSFALERGVKLMIFGLALDGVFILIRSIYRTIELSDGWTGRIISTEVYFNVLDGAAIVCAMYTLNVFHPGFLLGKANVWRSASKTPSEADSESNMKSGNGAAVRQV